MAPSRTNGSRRYQRTSSRKNDEPLTSVSASRIEQLPGAWLADVLARLPYSPASRPPEGLARGHGRQTTAGTELHAQVHLDVENRRQAGRGFAHVGELGRFVDRERVASTKQRTPDAGR